MLNSRTGGRIRKTLAEEKFFGAQFGRQTTTPHLVCLGGTSPDQHSRSLGSGRWFPFDLGSLLGQARLNYAKSPSQMVTIIQSGIRWFGLGQKGLANCAVEHSA